MSKPVIKWKPLPDKDPSPPQRPKNGYGTQGTKIMVTTNHFPVEVKNKKLVLYHYDVSIKDYKGDEMTPPLPKSKNMRIFERMKESFPKVFTADAPLGYDSVKNAYSTKLIPQLKSASSYEVSLESEEGKRKEDKKRANRSNYKVTMVNVNSASLQDLFDSMKYIPGSKRELPSTIIQMIEVMFRHYRAQKYEQVANRNFFSVNEEFARNRDIGGGKQGVTGFFGSLRPSAWKDGSILLNLDMAHTAFYKPQKVLEFIKEIDLGFRAPTVDFRDCVTPDIARKFTKALKGLKVRTTYTKRTYKIHEIHNLGPNKTYFDFTTDKGTKKITVQEYFSSHYDTRLMYPFFNCLNVGNQNKQVFIPAELCNIEKGQKVKKKLSDMEVSSFIKSTAVSPGDRLQQIKTVARENKFNTDPMLKAMTFTISDKPLEVQGRVLPAPGLTMNNRNFEPQYGVWDVRNKVFHLAAELHTWAVLNYDGRTRMDSTQKFIDRLVSMGKSKGMKINPPLDIYESRSPEPFGDIQYYKQKNPKLQLIMCVLPGRKYYGAIKKAGDTELHIVTQCVLGTNVFKCQDQTISNILLKINAKMDGVNNIVSIYSSLRTGLLQFNAPFLIMGADVNHPPAGGDSSIPSLAAVVGSYDPHATKYAVERRAQYHREEMICDMKEITMNLLKNFYQRTKFKPSRIIMYRDGVSESQFSEVLAKEMSAMRQACLQIQKDGMYTPGITFICVQKRHHTRLFCDEKYTYNQRNKNVPAGTIVDTEITHPTETDFFLCSHQGIQGTSKPTHYHLLWDDNDIHIDELQALTYKLCHVYSRCTRSVSIPTPVYYAHLAAFRGKVYVSEILGNDSESGSVMSGGGGGGEMEKLKVDIVKATRVTTSEALSTKLHYI